MRTLRFGMSGDDVRALQSALLHAGFNPGALDRHFGAATEAALLAYQHSAGLLPDGIAGPRTLHALGLAASNLLPDVIGGVSVQHVCRMFPSTPVGNIKRNLPPVLGALDANGLRDKPMVLMALATIRAEAEPFMPLEEGLSRYNTSPQGHPYDLYDNRADLGNRGAPDGVRYRGRGFVQLTGRFNYRKFGPLLGSPADLEQEPDRASVTEVAAELLALFLKNQELNIKRALLNGDLARARALVNGGSHGLDRFAQAYRTGYELFPEL